MLIEEHTLHTARSGYLLSSVVLSSTGGYANLWAYLEIRWFASMTTWCSWRLMRKTVLSSLLAAWSVGDALHKKWELPENISRGTSQNLWSLLTLKRIFSALLEMPVPYPLLQRRREPMGDGQQIPLHPFAVAACYLDLPWDVPFPCQAVDRLAIAYSLAQSVRLSYWEQRIDQWVAATRTIPEDMANTGAVGRKHCTIAVTHCFSFFETKIPFHTQRFILWKSCNSSDLWSWSKRYTFHHQIACVGGVKLNCRVKHLRRHRCVSVRHVHRSGFAEPASCEPDDGRVVCTEKSGKASYLSLNAMVLRPNEQMQLWHVTKVQRSLLHVRFTQGFYLVGFSELWKKVSLQLVAIGWSGELGVWHLRHTRCLLGLRRVWTVLSRDKARIHDDSHDHRDEPRLSPLAADFLDTLSGFTWTWTDASTSWINGLRWEDKIQKGSSKTKHETHPTMLCNVCGLESLPAVSRCWRTCLMFCKTSWTRGRSTGRPGCRSKALHSPARTLCWLSCSVYYWYGLIWYDIMYWIHEMVATCCDTCCPAPCDSSIKLNGGMPKIPPATRQAHLDHHLALRFGSGFHCLQTFLAGWGALRHTFGYLA